jgi:hypothetical protein
MRNTATGGTNCEIYVWHNKSRTFAPFCFIISEEATLKFEYSDGLGARLIVLY